MDGVIKQQKMDSTLGRFSLEGIVWDELGRSDDHIVPHPGVEPANESITQVEFQAKRSCGSASVIGSTDNKSSVVETVVQGNRSGIIHPTIGNGKAPMLDKGLWSHRHDDVFPASSDDAYVTSEDAKASNNCFNSGNEESVGNGFCTDDSLLENGADRVESNLCHFPLDDMSPDDDGFKFFGNESDHKETNDLMDYGWPDIGNFEDVDRMFRNSDSTFGQGSACNAINEMSWFSASDVIDGSEDAIKSGFISSSSGPTLLQNLSRYHEGDKKFLFVSDSPTAVHNDENRLTFQANTQRKHTKNIDRSGGKRKDQSLECINGTANGLNGMKIPERLEPSHSETSVPRGSYEICSQQKQPWTDDSMNYFHSYIPHVKPEYNLPANHHPGTPAVSCSESETQNHPPVSHIASSLVANSSQPVKSFDLQSKFPATTPEEKLKKSRRRKQIRSTLTNEDQREHSICQTAFSDQASGQLQLPNDTGGDSVVEETGTGLPTVEIDSSSVQRGSCLGSVLYDESSLEASSFYQLQDVLEQLDVRTKLCIRDSLYRLAWSAEQRHSFGAANDASRDDRVGSGAPTTEESNKCARCLGAETNTNPIDRSIAHLLFYRPSESSGRPATDAVSLESHIAVKSTSQHPMPDHPVSEKDVSQDTDSELMVMPRAIHTLLLSHVEGKVDLCGLGDSRQSFVMYSDTRGVSMYDTSCDDFCFKSPGNTKFRISGSWGVGNWNILVPPEWVVNSTT
ncbi:hypothetical protein ACLOJK_013302 [Asimina triloba]